MRRRDVVLLHGLGADRRAWQRFERLLPDEWHVTAIDLLGHGDAPHPRHGYSLDDHARYLESALGSLGMPSTAIVGHSYGAAAAIALAAIAPSIVELLVLLDPVVDRTRSDTMTSGMRASIGRDRSSGTEQMMEAKRTGTLPQAVERLFPAESPALRRWIVETWERMAVGVIEEIDTDWTRFAPAVSARVTVVHGDPLFGGAGDEAVTCFASARGVRIAGAGHYIHATHARDTAAAVVEAIDGVEAPT